ncbi:myosin-binding protein 1-like isoform X2 [Cynara cardunculus var. scolymus]|uniref:myosin-binding protein 1-like isoform X2 n=1 Tax=Cynara cardunculus var. scolymus TaxID=59895 RepID=UPI000D623E81|nr:myosin-binding protein 1-like isoform X2 [Cynara cardunculus var. scolymus]
MELPISDNECGRAFIHLDSRSKVLDLHNDPVTVTASDSGELKWRTNANKEETSRVTEQISSDEVQLSNLAETPADVFLEITDQPRTGEVIKDPVAESDPSTTMNGHRVSNHLDLGDAYKLAISSKGRQLLDQKSFQDSSTRVTEDIKLLLSHRSNDNLISPKPSFNSDELMGIQFLQKRLSLERNESNISLDGSIVSEIDGETVVDRLKRQVEHDKKVMGILYKELEEERNASAVATNQAMAMITRLQEEKAALYTEALQCLRMMEEQAEYNSEALQKANDLIEEKEKQILDLEEIVRKISEDGRE